MIRCLEDRAFANTRRDEEWTNDGYQATRLNYIELAALQLLIRIIVCKLLAVGRNNHDHVIEGASIGGPEPPRKPRVHWLFKCEHVGHVM